MANSKKSTILGDHQRVGKRLIPPYVYLIGAGKDMEWRQRIIPEYLWLGLLNFTLGWAQGAELCLSLAQAAAESVGVEPAEFEKKFGKAPKLNFALTSSYASLKPKQRIAVLSRLEKRRQLRKLQNALRPLLALYPECPLRFLNKSAPQPGEDDVTTIRELIGVLFDEEVTLTVSMVTNAVYIAFCTNKLRVIVSDKRDSPYDPELANFREIEKYPTTEESRKVARSVRLAASMLAQPEEGLAADRWPEYFWNRGLAIQRCSSPPLNRLEIE